jgi:hypothetical protein
MYRSACAEVLIERVNGSHYKQTGDLTTLPPAPRLVIKLVTFPKSGISLRRDRQAHLAIGLRLARVRTRPRSI